MAYGQNLRRPLLDKRKVRGMPSLPSQSQNKPGVVTRYQIGVPLPQPSAAPRRMQAGAASSSLRAERKTNTTGQTSDARTRLKKNRQSINADYGSATDTPPVVSQREVVDETAVQQRSEITRILQKLGADFHAKSHDCIHSFGNDIDKSGAQSATDEKETDKIKELYDQSEVDVTELPILFAKRMIKLQHMMSSSKKQGEAATEAKEFELTFEQQSYYKAICQQFSAENPLPKEDEILIRDAVIKFCRKLETLREEFLYAVCEELSCFVLSKEDRQYVTQTVLDFCHSKSQELSKEQENAIKNRIAGIRYLTAEESLVMDENSKECQNYFRAVQIANDTSCGEALWNYIKLSECGQFFARAIRYRSSCCEPTPAADGDALKLNSAPTPKNPK